MVQVILIRHGETEWNKIHQIQGGNSDIPLNKTGEHQAECLGTRLKSEPIQAVYSSPLLRSLDTARAIAKHHQLEVCIEPDIREFNLGELEGVKIGELNKSYREILFTNSDGEVLPRVPGGESLREVQERAWSVIQRIVSQHSDGVIAVSGHYFVLITIICHALTLPLQEMGRLRLDTASVSTIAFEGQFTRLLLLNDICHL